MFCFATFIFLSSCLSDQAPKTEDAGNIKTQSIITSKSTSSQNIYFNDSFAKSIENKSPLPEASDFDLAFFPNQAFPQKNVEPSQDSPVNYTSNESFFAQFDTFDFKVVADQFEFSNSNISKSSSQSSLVSTVSANV